MFALLELQESKPTYELWKVSLDIIHSSHKYLLEIVEEGSHFLEKV
jgi:hypothetical protein